MPMHNVQHAQEVTTFIKMNNVDVMLIPEMFSPQRDIFKSLDSLYATSNIPMVTQMVELQ